jgi:hypothetical protein
VTQEFFAGREAATLSAPYSNSDSYFAAQRIDGAAIREASFAHCTFANISFKEVDIEVGEFENCVFLSCYFRKAHLRHVDFRGCKFIDCAFPSIDIAECSFSFPTFRGCFIEFERIEACLPDAPNERYLMTANLETQAREAGDINEARLFRLESLGAWENHLLAAAKGDSQYYQEHYPTSHQRGRQLWRLVRSKVNGFAWGYGERGWILIRNFLIMTLVLFPLIFLGLRDQFLIEGSPPKSATPEEYILISLSNVLPGAWAPNVIDASVLVQFFRASESLLGILMGGMLVSLLLKAVSRR